MLIPSFSREIKGNKGVLSIEFEEKKEVLVDLHNFDYYLSIDDISCFVALDTEEDPNKKRKFSVCAFEVFSSYTGTIPLLVFSFIIKDKNALIFNIALQEAERLFVVERAREQGYFNFRLIFPIDQEDLIKSQLTFSLNYSLFKAPVKSQLQIC